MADRFGNPVQGECQSVTDNTAPDQNEFDGAFSLTNLKLGTWVIRETAAPYGFTGDFTRIETVTLNLGQLDGAVADPWVNTSQFAAQIAPTDTTCQMYVNNTADDLTDVFYGVKAGKINNTAPGVFFYYTTFTAPANGAFTLETRQANDKPGFSFFNVQNLEQIRLFNMDCSTPLFTWTAAYTNGQVVIAIQNAIPGQQYVLSVKYETGSVVGLPDPGTVHFGFATAVDGNVVDQDADGVYLRNRK
jgi:hypothetical protein